MQKDDLLTVPEAATLMRLKVCTVRKWISQGKIGHVKLGGRVFVRHQEIESLIAGSFVPPRKNLAGVPAQGDNGTRSRANRSG